MSGTLRVLWTVSSSLTTPPRPILRCSRCDAPRPFASSGRFRLNANGKRLDAWLVYRCASCGDSWNRPIFERRPRSEIDPVLLDALQANDPARADMVARDLAGLSRWTTRFEDQSDAPPLLDRALIDGDPATASVLEITIAAGASAVRGDRLMALGLGVSRARLDGLVGSGRLVAPNARKLLARPLVAATVLVVDLSGLEDAPRLAAAGAGLDHSSPD